MATGRVKFYDPEKGFGFLSQDGGGADAFVNKAGLAAGVRGLSPSQQVEFEVGTGQRGLYARSVRPLPAVPSTGVATSSEVAALRLSQKELDALISDMITLLDTTVLPELGRGRYPDPARAKPAAEAVRALARELEAAAAPAGRPRVARARRRPH
jgi:CspA family cold shock protein